MSDEEMNLRIKNWFDSLTPEQQGAFNRRTARLWVALEETDEQPTRTDADPDAGTPEALEGPRPDA